MSWTSCAAIPVSRPAAIHLPAVAAARSHRTPEGRGGSKCGCGQGGATRCHMTWVCGWPCKSRTGSPVPPERTLSRLPPTSTLNSFKTLEHHRILLFGSTSDNGFIKVPPGVTNGLSVPPALRPSPRPARRSAAAAPRPSVSRSSRGSLNRFPANDPAVEKQYVERPELGPGALRQADGSQPRDPRRSGTDHPARPARAVCHTSFR